MLSASLQPLGSILRGAFGIYDVLPLPCEFSLPSTFAAPINQGTSLARSGTKGGPAQCGILGGVTVAVGLFSLVLLPVPFLRSVGVGGMLVPLIATASALTLLPIALEAWSPWIERRRLWQTSTTFSRHHGLLHRGIDAPFNAGSRPLVGIGEDAIIIRTLLVPALVSLMGKWNWWTPSWLRKTLGEQN